MTTLWWCQQSRSHWKQWSPFTMGLQPILEQLTKIFVITVKELEPATSSVRDQHATSVPARHVRDRIFKLCPIHASVTYQISWICWIRWIPVPFRENSIVSIRPVSQASSQHCRSIDTDAQCKRALRLYFFWSPEAIQKPENSTQSWRFQFTFDEIRYFTTCWPWSQEFYSEWWRPLRSWCRHQRRIDTVMVCRQRGYFTSIYSFVHSLTINFSQASVCPRGGGGGG